MGARTVTGRIGTEAEEAVGTQWIVRAYDEHDRGPEQPVGTAGGEDGDPK